MMDVIYPITRLAGQEGKAADVIHAIAVEMMELRADLLHHSTRIPKSEIRVARKQARLLEEYAAALNAIYYQLEPERWNPVVSKEIHQVVQAYKIALPDWMNPEQEMPVRSTAPELPEETIESALNRFENEGGRNAPPREYL